MSTKAYSLAVRNHLRENLTNFYNGIPTHKAANCRVMVDERPAPNCGEEFISIYGEYHKPRNKYSQQAIEEECGLTIAVSRKIALIPQDARGELGYITPLNLHSNIVSGDPDLVEQYQDSNLFYMTFQSVEERCREIVGLLVGPNRYRLMNEANSFLQKTTVTLDDEGEPTETVTLMGVNWTEPLLWQGTDAKPTQVGPDHFWGYQDLPPDADATFGLMMQIYFGDAIRLQSVDLYA